MTIDKIKAVIPDYAKDIALNLTRVLTEEGSKGLTRKEVFGVALATALVTKDTMIRDAILQQAREELVDIDIQAIKSAVSIMAMNNVYYRTIGMLSDATFSHLPVGLRMQVISNSGIPKREFELYSLAVSALNGCAHCVESHSKIVLASGFTHEAVQSSIRIGAVIQAVAQINAIERA